MHLTETRRQHAYGSNIVKMPMPQDGAVPRRVFVVDDEPNIAATLAIILRVHNFRAVPYCNPLKALQVPDDQLPELLISDVNMPELSGIELAVRMQQRCPTCKVLLISGQTVSADLLAVARDAGHHFELLLKPIHPRDLLFRIHALLSATA